MKVPFLFILALFIGNVLSAQVTFPGRVYRDSLVPGILQDLNVKQDPRLEKMLKMHIEKNKKVAGLDGYRVEFYFSGASNAKNEAFKKKVEFLSNYPDNTVYIKYEAPDFRVRVGDFRTKNEALKLKEKIKEDYPSAFIVPCKIEFPLLKQ